MIYFRRKVGQSADPKKQKYKIVDKHDKIVRDKKVIEYIKSLVIPPAYDDVKIFYESSPKILYEGYDSKNRKQQIYSKAHKKKAIVKKFKTLLEFGQVLPEIRKTIEKNIRAPIQNSSVKNRSDETDTKEKLIAIILKIIMICGFRIGNLRYQRMYNSFGISNIYKKHISMKRGGMYIKFIGKKGVKNECIIEDKTLINEVSALIKNKNPSDYVFTYEKNGAPQVISARDVNSWLKKYHKDITSKSFRTWDTNTLFIEYMRSKENPTKITKAQRKKNVISAMKVISCQINNTPTICKKEYLHGDLFELYIEHPRKYKKYFCGCDKSADCFIKYLRSMYSFKQTS